MPIANVLGGDTAGLRRVSLAGGAPLDLRPHTGYWFALELTTADAPFTGALTLERDGNCWPFEFTYREVDAYAVGDAGEVLATAASGMNRPAGARDYDGRLTLSAVRVDVPASRTRRYWVRVQHAEGCQLHIRASLLSEAAMASAPVATAERAWLQLITGATLVLLLIALLLYAWFGEAVYLWYSVFALLLAVGPMLILYRDAVYALAFRQNPWAIAYLQTAIAVTRIVALLQFGRLFVRTREKFPAWDRVLLAAMAVLTFLLLGGILSRASVSAWNGIYDVVRVPLALACFGALTAALVRLALSGDLYARIFGYGVVVSVVALLIRVVDLRLSDAPNQDAQGPLISFGMLASMTLALAYRFKALADERAAAQAEKLRAERLHSEALARVNEASDRFVPHAFLRQLGHRNILDAQLGDFTERVVTVLFADIRDYTSLSEAMTPADTFRFVTEFNRRVGPLITAHEGFVNQYLGDGIMALFPGRPEDALAAAVAMQHGVRAYNAEREAGGRRPIRVGVGLHRGPLIMGIIGDDRRLDAATISDTVNLASRVEGLTKHFACDILLTDACHAALSAPAAHTLRYLGRVRAKGKAEPVGVYECCDGLSPKPLTRRRETAEDFARAVADYHAGDFAAAATAFARLRDGGDGPAGRYLERCVRYLREAPAGEWDGVERMGVK